MNYYIGLDIGGTKMAAGVVDENYNIIGRCQTPTLGSRPQQEIIDDIIKVVENCTANANLTLKDIKQIGIGCPGSVNPKTGTIERANNLSTFDMTPIKQILEDHFKINVSVENDANAAAYGEFIAGAGVGKTDFVAVTLGTGVGSGIIIDSKIYNGINYAAGELGHTVIEIDGEYCNCGRYGCWEAYASGTAFGKQIREALSQNPDSLMWQEIGNDIKKIRASVAFNAMRKGDEVAKKLIKRYTRYVGCGIVNIINTFQPELICIGGGISHEGDCLLGPLNAMVMAERYSINCKMQTELCNAKLGNDAGIIGAAFIHRQNG